MRVMADKLSESLLDIQKYRRTGDFMETGNRYVPHT